MVRCALSALVLLTALAAAAPAAAACRLALVLALDNSSSVDADERVLQLEGLAQALEHEDVRQAFLALPGTHVSLLIFEWSGQYDQTILQGWTRIESAAALGAVAGRLRAPPPRLANRPTALGAALGYARARLGEQAACLEKKIDVSGDGRNNDGIPPQIFYARQDFAEITVNALAISQDLPSLPEYFRESVIRGQGAFVMEATNFETYSRAIREKLIREISVPRLGWLGRD